MSGEHFFFIEIVLFFGLFLAWAIWELVSVRRSQKRDRDLSAERARTAEGQNRPEQG